MIRQQCNALRNRQSVGGLVSGCYSATIRPRAWTTQARNVSTTEGTDAQDEKQVAEGEASPAQIDTQPSIDSSGDGSLIAETTTSHSGGPRIRKIRFSSPNEAKIDPKQSAKRLQELQQWAVRKVPSRGNEPGDFRHYRPTIPITSNTKSGFPSEYNFKPMEAGAKSESGGGSPVITREAVSKYRSKKFTKRADGELVLSSGVPNSSLKSTLQLPTSERVMGLGELFQRYGSRKRGRATTWSPDNIEGLDDTAAALEQAEKASNFIDASLRHKLLKSFKDTPVEQPNENEVDMAVFSQAVLKIPQVEPAEKWDKDPSSLYSKLPQEAVAKLQRAKGKFVDLSIPKATWASLSTDELYILLANMDDRSRARASDDLVALAKKGLVLMNVDIAAKILVPLGSLGEVDKVREHSEALRNLGVYVTWAHLLRAYRVVCRKQDSRIKEIEPLIPEIAKQGFDERAYGALILLYADSGRRDLAIALFNNAPDFINTYPLNSNFVHNALLWTLRHGGLAEEAEFVFQAMRSGSAPAPDDATYGHVAQAYRLRPDYFRKLLFLVQDYIKSGLPFNEEVFTALMKACATAGRLDVVLSLFNHLFSKPEFRPNHILVSDYLHALLMCKLDNVDESMFAIGMPMDDKLPLNYDETEVDQSYAMARDGQSPSDIIETSEIEKEESSFAQEEEGEGDKDPSQDKYYMPKAPVVPSNSGELIALADLQYQHIRKHYPQLLTKNTQRLYLRLFVSHGFHETFKKAYRYLALATGLRGRQSIFPDYRKRTTASFSDFGKESTQQPPIGPDERFEFDYLNQPLSQVDIYPALRSAYETKDLEFAKLAIQDYDTIVRDHSDKLDVRTSVRETWHMTAEAAMIQTLTHCGDIEAAYQRFEQAMETIVWDADRPRIFAKRIAVFTGTLVNLGLTNMTNRVFEKLQLTEWEKQVAMRRRPMVFHQQPKALAEADPRRKAALDPSLV